MGAARCSAFHKVGPNDAKPNHEPGRGQIKSWKRATNPRNQAGFHWMLAAWIGQVKRDRRVSGVPDEVASRARRSHAVFLGFPGPSRGLRPPAMLIEGYEIESRIGRGGMGEVFRGRVLGGPRAGSLVAVKRLLPELASERSHVALFEREARLVSRLRHPGIVAVLETGVEAGAPFIVMEYVDGRDLRWLLAACAARSILLPVDFALHVAHEVAGALQYAHGARGEDGRPLGFVHCDVSPSNVFVSRLGEVKLGDFGVARAASDGRARGVFGKVRYLAPEQLRREPVAPHTDVFGLGAVLHELLTGVPAFPGSDPVDVARRILSGARRPPSVDRPEVPPEVDAIVLRALSLDQRHPDAGLLAADLAPCYDPAIGNPLAIAALVRGLFPG